MTRTPPELAAALNSIVRVGLRQQGHMATVETMLRHGATWDEIGSAINWHGPTAREWWEREALEDLRLCGPSCPVDGKRALEHEWKLIGEELRWFVSTPLRRGDTAALLHPLWPEADAWLGKGLTIGDMLVVLEETR